MDIPVGESKVRCLSKAVSMSVVCLKLICYYIYHLSV